ncbi:unnamed protein product [Adineta steineri]|uniref:Uncharacterized protein n=2 Tax=Adineta steineri TaxID=433720 RepID=A0A818UNY2_9BILA|nr:unnamed protein product [Adineta steineri]
MIIINCLCTIAFISSSTNNENNRIDPIVRNLKHIVDTALQQDTFDDINNELLIEQLSHIIEQQEGLTIIDRKQRSIDETSIYDGSGDLFDDGDLPVFTGNLSVVTITMGTTTTAFNTYTPQKYPACPCEKGDRGEKGDHGICPTDCGWKYDTHTKDCLGSQVNLNRLAQAIRQLILDTKKIAFRNAQGTSCVCPTTPPPSTTMSTVSNQLSLDYNMYIRLKGDKGDRGDTGTSCSSTCMQSTQTNVRVFSTIKEATDASYSLPDHTYVHVVDNYRRLQAVFIRVHGHLIPIRLGNEISTTTQGSTLPATAIAIPSSRCRTTLSCSTLHMFALGPNVHGMCGSNRGTSSCSRLSDFNDLCQDVSRRNQLKGYYKAFMSASTQWLSHLFAGICVNAKIINMNNQTLFDKVEDIFEHKPPKSAFLDVKGSKPEFQYWWHGTSADGRASSDTCK